MHPTWAGRMGIGLDGLSLLEVMRPLESVKS
jgi:hypothetical protein